MGKQMRGGEPTLNVYLIFLSFVQRGGVKKQFSFYYFRFLFLRSFFSFLCLAHMVIDVLNHSTPRATRRLPGPPYVVGRRRKPE